MTLIQGSHEDTPSTVASESGRASIRLIVVCGVAFGQELDGVSAAEETSLSEALEDVGLSVDERGEVQQLQRLTKKQRDLVTLPTLLSLYMQSYVSHISLVQCSSVSFSSSSSVRIVQLIMR